MKEIKIYTDGSARGNPGPGGFGAVLLYKGYRKEVSAGFARTTNNRMEILAAIEALSQLTERCSVTVYSDSRYLIDAMTRGWLEGWRRKGWSRGPAKPLKNVDLWKRIGPLSEKHDIRWVWVRGHSGVPENERCDQLATRAADRSNLPPDRGFEG